MYAPFSTWVHDDPDAGTTNAKFVNGTSFSSPFAAAIAALIKAANPSLDANGIWNIMRDTAHTRSSGTVHRWVNAYDAVLAALGNNAPPFVHITSPTEGNSYSMNSVSVPLACNVDDNIPGSVTVNWSSSLEGSIGAASANTAHVFDTLGTHEITCSVSDGEFTVSDAVSIHIVNDPPTVTILQPEPGSSFFVSQNIAVSAQAVDPNNNLAGIAWQITNAASAVLWSGSGTNANVPGGTLSPGSYTLRATATDAAAASNSQAIALVIVTDPVNLPPSISNPQLVLTPTSVNGDSSSNYYADVCLTDVNGSDPGNGDCRRFTFSATVSDDHDSVGDLSFSWEIRRDGGVISTPTTANANLTVDLTATSFCEADHQVKLTVTDTGDSSSTYTWFFNVCIIS
ncbi:MAG: Ig-like domain-containing protein [Myxococcota bacterium]